MVEKFLPNEGEKNYRKNIKNIKKLKPGTYLLKQKKFGGKGFDSAIIIIDNNFICKVFLFQISIYKQEIFEIDTLKLYILDFIEYFKLFFDFFIPKENVYFTYIFEPSNEKLKQELINKCKKKKMPYIFFSISKQIFEDEDFYEINDANKIFICPFNEKQNIINETKISNRRNINHNTVNLSELQIENLITFIKKQDNFNIFKSKEIYLKFSHTITNIDKNYLNNEILLIRALKTEDEIIKCKNINQLDDKKKKVIYLKLIIQKKKIKIKKNKILLKLKMKIILY